MRMILSILLLAAFAPAQVIMIQQVANSKPPVHPSGPTYTYVADESGSCSKVVASVLGNGTACTVTITATAGDIVAINCVTLGNTPSGDCTISFAAGAEVPSEIVTLSPNDPTATFGDSSGWVLIFTGSGSETIVANSANGGGSGDNPGGLGIGNMVAMTVDGWNSSTGWLAIDGGTAQYVLAPAAGPCTVTAVGPTSQTNELIYGSCFATAGTASSTTGYTIAQNDPFTSIGQSLTAYKGITSIQTPSFVTDGTLTDPQSLIMTFEPN